MDIISLYNDFTVQYWTEGKNVSPGWVNIQCPDHFDTNHLGYNLKKDYYNCWKCGPKKTEDVLIKVLGLNYYEVKKIMSEYSGRGFLNINNDKKQQNVVKKIELPGTKLQKIHKKYLKSRGFDPDYIEKKYKITGTDIVGDWKYRIIIPVFDKNNRLVTFQSRDITDKQKLRYKALSKEKSIIDCKNILYSAYNLRKIYILVVEGIMDVWRFGDNTCCTFGTSVTDMQLKLLSAFEKVIFLFDSEYEAQQKAKKYANQLASVGVVTEVVDLEMDGKDPADLTDEEASDVKRELFKGL